MFIVVNLYQLVLNTHYILASWLYIKGRLIWDFFQDVMLLKAQTCVTSLNPTEIPFVEKTACDVLT